MGGYGVINLDKLRGEKLVFKFFSKYLSYPMEKLNVNKDLERVFSLSHPAYDHIKTFSELMKHKSLAELQETYAEIFDFQEDATLFMTYVKYEDSRSRGQMLARLKVFYEMFGLTMSDGELSDLLPLMCEFVYVANWEGDERSQQGFNLLFAIIEDGTYHLMQALKKYESPYYYLVRGIRETCKNCLISKGVYAND